MRRNTELLAAGATILVISALYFLFTAQGVPASGTGPGHWLGIAGMAMMLATETLYSMRKRMESIRLGKLRDWLSVHIFMGIVGPFLVLLHAAWHYRGLAAFALALTVLVVASGFIGRYIYTRIPRSASGVELQAAGVQSQIAELNRKLGGWPAIPPVSVPAAAPQTQPRAEPVAAGVLAAAGAAPLAARPVGVAAPPSVSGKTTKAAKREAEQAAQEARMRQEQTAEMAKLLKQRQALERQLATLDRSRRVLAVWHTVHVPLGLVLFAAAATHAVVALYFRW